MNKDLITHVSNAIMLALLVGIPVWFTFFPRRYERSWPSVLKPLLAIPCTVGAIYEFRYTLYYASSVAHTKTDPTTIFGSPPLFGFIIHALVIGIPVWFIFFSPRDERSWPSVLRRLLAITCDSAVFEFHCVSLGLSVASGLTTPSSATPGRERGCEHPGARRRRGLCRVSWRAAQPVTEPVG